MEERYFMVESNANIYLITLLFIIVSVIGCGFEQIEVLIYGIPVGFAVYLIRKIKSQYRIKIFSNKLIVTRRKNRYSYKNLYSTEMEDVAINYNELSYIEIRRIGDVFLALSPIPRRLKNKEIIIHLKTGEDIDIKRLNWNNEFEEKLDYKRQKLLIYTNSGGKIIKKNKNSDEKILNELIKNNNIEIKKVDKYIKNTKEDKLENKKTKNNKNILIGLKKIGQLIISKKIYLIISVGLLACAFIVLMLLKKHKKIGGNIIELYDRYGEVQCEFSDIDFPDEYTGNIYIKNNKILKKNNSNDEIRFIDGNNWYNWGGDFYDYFGGYKGCNLSIMDEDYLGNKIDTKYVISMLFSGEDADLQAIKCKNKVNDAFDFELPKHCDFENEFSLSGWKEYKFRDLFSFKYPDGLNITDRKFNYILNNHYRDFDYTPNIFINIYDFNNFIGEIASDSYTSNSLLNNDDYNKYYQLLENIANGNGVKTIQSSDFFDHISRYETIGPIAAHQINIDGINGLLINYYFTNDESKGCITQFVTELLLVKNYNEIISIIFKNNFGEVEKVLNNNVNKYYDFYQTQDGQFCNEKDFWLTNDLKEFYKYGGNTSAFEFQINYEVIKEIIRTIKINK